MTTKKSSAKSDLARSEVRITVADQSREITIETAADRDEVLTAAKKALAAGEPLVLTDTRGRQFLIPAAKISSIEIGDITERRVGFATL
ncbi:MAG: DUF3107 domain-containing protein [Actinobacteria bacterium]|jgi:Protein of unknown function (DUF3107)|nr:DUF3107 domain-containing protein [Actinomycetota bacterium]